jgi:hypothetical protein
MSFHNNGNPSSLSPTELVNAFNGVMSRVHMVTDNTDLLQQANEIAENIIKFTKQSYENTCKFFVNLRGRFLKTENISSI